MQIDGYSLDAQKTKKVAPEKLKTVIRHPIKAREDYAHGVHQSYKG